MRLKTVLAATLIALMTAACAQNGQYGTKQTIVALAGAECCLHGLRATRVDGLDGFVVDAFLV